METVRHVSDSTWTTYHSISDMITLLLLPDEIWITILDEWIGNEHILTFCSLDIALCNQLLRERYLHLLQNYSSFLFNKMHFQKIQSDTNSHLCVSKLFFEWCWKRKIFPTSLALCLNHPIHDHLHAMLMQQEDNEYNNSLDKEKMLSAVEMLKYCRIHNTTTTFPTSDILNEFPKLRFLQIHGERMNTPTSQTTPVPEFILSIPFSICCLSHSVFRVTQCVLS